MKKSILLSLCLLVGNSIIFAQWQRISESSHYFVNGITQFGQNLYASSRQAMYTRPLNSDTWQEVVDTPSNFYPGEFFQIGDTLYTHSIFGLYRSEDGDSWENVSVQPSNLTTFYLLFDNLIFATKRFQPAIVYRSSDGGRTWETDTLATGNVNQLYFAGNVDGDLYLWLQITNLPGTRIFKSDNLGETWTDLGALTVGGTLGVPSEAIQVGNRIFMPGGQATFGINFSDDGGQTWGFSNNGLPVGLGNTGLYSRGSVVFFSATYQNTHVYYRSTDNGLNWTQMAEVPQAYSGVFTTDNAIYLFADFNKLYRSTYDGTSWMPANFPAENDFRPTYIWKSGNRVALHGEGGIYISTDNGQNWSLNRNGLQPYELNIEELVRQGSNLFAATNAGMFRSSDQAVNWQLLQNGLPRLPSFFPEQQIVATPSALLMATPLGAFRSNDHGDNWQEFNIGGPETPDLFAAKSQHMNWPA